ncbi:Hypothetical Protein CGB_J0040W [Cryptococcus gattii WM276]|uniref:Uncharacterized protein n=2 Tax=Cryptococcus gattii TaxID=37769 RepID=E6RCH8_CRYGW|nr:Hypothetical Protein CGB_J0040W [Cryptococcus gattii WM276]ADV24540.1 Hypothetical Protein CGB_J0040W [Cryptococcus gattii WM276]KIR80329.1 hypothetical protein I306_02618 [Cryptococcus gattii EJB2]KJE01288.1 hypothetical protein I311_05046 [Cryptococcus gattii NT-10]
MSHEFSPLFDLENSPASPLSPSLASSPSLPSSKLKRLSLVAKPRTSSLDIERGRPVPTASVKNMTSSLISSTPTGNRRQIRHSVIGSPAGITYSPPPAGTGGSINASSMDMRNGGNLHSSRGAHSQSIYGSSIGVRQEGVEASREKVGESEESQTLDPQTFMDRHADFLRLIAQKERRVHELKEELQQQESSLESLKVQWSSLVSLAAPSSQPSTSVSPSPSEYATHPRNPRARGSLASSTLTSFSTSELSTASSSSPPTIGGPPNRLRHPPSCSSHILTQPNPSADVNGGGLERALSGIITHTEEYLGPEVVQGGIKFLGNLWKTVGAAAGGTVPLSSIAEREGETRGREENCLMDETEGEDGAKN